MLLAPLLFASLAVAPCPPQTTVPMTSSASTPDYKFPSGAGMLFFYVRPDKAADFEAVVARLGEVLDKTEDPVRKQQAANWRVLRSVEATGDSAIYVFVFVPAVTTADYDPIKVLSEAMPTEVQALYERLRDDVIRVERMGLARVR
jgi:hypothetical protein